MPYTFLMKLFVFDVDGTLVAPGEHDIPKQEIEAMQALLDQGHAIALASGRPLCSLVHHLSPLKGDRKYYICSNGGATYDNDENIIAETTLSYNDFVHLQKYASPNINVYGYEGKDKMVSLVYDKWIQLEEELNLIEKKNIFILDGHSSNGHNAFQKIMIAGDPEYISKVIIDKKEGRYEYSRSSPTFIEFLQKGSTKGKRVDDLRKYLGLKIEDVYCFGDQENDLSMIEPFVGVAVDNAIPKVKEASKYITKSVSNHGVSYALKEILRII